MKAGLLNREIFQKVKECYELFHRPAQMDAFVPGKTRVNYAGRFFDEREMLNLADSSLDFS